jgi:hypothetical protein
VTRGVALAAGIVLCGALAAGCPEWPAIVRDLNAILRESKPHWFAVMRLGRQLELQDCVT